MAAKNMHMKFEIEILKQTWVTLRKPCHLQTDGQTDGRTRWIQYTPTTNFVGRGYKNVIMLEDEFGVAWSYQHSRPNSSESWL